tara:strand:- start:1462 stop:2121 length:660 start_codon:yes stop_codon:yes gene_type:complete
VKVYWSYEIGADGDKFPPEFINPPKKYLAGYDSKYDHAKCPAWKHYYDNTYVIEQPFDLGIKFKDDSIQSNLPQKAVDKYFHLGDNWLAGEYPEIQLMYNWYFWTDKKDVWIEQLAPTQLSRLGIDLIQGTFPITSWFRPIVIGFKLLDNDIYIPRGTPVTHIRFPSKTQVQLEQGTPPPELKSQLAEQNTLRLFAKFKTWDIIMNRNKKEKRCPFRWN